MKITIEGQVPPKKNSKRLVLVRGKPRFIPSKQHEQWEEQALWQLKRFKPLEMPLTANYKFYVKDNRGRDLDNMIASVNDVLVKAIIIENDTWQNLSIGSASAEIDKLSPRVELELITKGER